MGARIVKQKKYNVNNNNTNKNVMIPKKINKKTIEYRECQDNFHGFIFDYVGFYRLVYEMLRYM